jgi:hypothetical protein
MLLRSVSWFGQNRLAEKDAYHIIDIFGVL